MVVVGCRQHALFVVMHEGTHFLISGNRKRNDWISNLLAAWPVGVSTERYRIRHWLHHRYLNTDKDPDWARKKGVADWAFPTSRSGFWKLNLPYLFGKGALEMAYAIRAFGVGGKDWIVALPYYALIAGAITALGGWKVFLLYWALPYVTVNPMIHRFRYTTEHMALPWTHQLNFTRNIRCTALENFLLSPMNGSLHLIHHIYPYIPWYRLKKAYAFLHRNEDFHRHAYELDAYFPTKEKNVFAELTAGGKPERPQKIAA
jgi:fatty acid desaturase